jgi:ubiquitin-protein ligase
MSAISKIWGFKKQKLLRELEEAQRRSPVLRVLGTHVYDDELRAMVEFNTTILVKGPDQAICEKGPVLVGIRYHRELLSTPVVPWEIVTVLLPQYPFHPNISPTGSICLGHPPPAMPMMEILHMTWAALTFNVRVMDTVDWHGLNPEAAAYVRANKEKFPLTMRGLFEPVPHKREEKPG